MLSDHRPFQILASRVLLQNFLFQSPMGISIIMPCLFPASAFHFPALLASLKWELIQPQTSCH